MPNDSSFSRPDRGHWLWIAIAIATLALVIAALIVTRPLPPRTVVMAAGPEGGVYYAIAERYRDIFARHRITLELKPTNGTVENIELLNDPGSSVSVALAQGGITNPRESPALVSLGTLFYEPFWLFSGVGDIEAPKRVRDLRVSLGERGSGTYELGHRLFQRFGLDLARMKVLELGHTEAGEALMRGELDLVAVSLPWEADILQRMLRDPDIETISWARADALVALRPYLIKRILPRGIADLAADRPPHDVTLVASKSNLLVRESLHPALQHLLLEAASEIHSAPGVFNKAGEFPAAEPIDVPLSDLARQYYRSGPPVLQRYLPFWLAAYASKVLILLIPIIGFAYPLSRLMPGLYNWSMQHRILRLYGELKFLETELDLDMPGAAADALEKLDRLEKQANRMYVSTAFNQMLYTLKQHINLVRERLSNHPSEGQSRATASENQSTAT